MATSISALSSTSGPDLSQHPSPPPPLATRTIYTGLFISSPTPGPNGKLLIQHGAVLVSRRVLGAGEHDDIAEVAGAEGVIEAVSWDVQLKGKGKEERVKEAKGLFGLHNGDGNEEGEGDEVKVVEVGGNGEGFFFPGFVDTHIHAPQYPNAGIFGTSTLLDWLKTYTFPLEASLSPSSPPINSPPSTPATNSLIHAQKIYTRLLSRTLAAGTTTASYFATTSVRATNLLSSLVYTTGQRAFIGRVCMDNPETCPDYYCDSSAEESLRKTHETIEYTRRLDPAGVRVLPVLTPRFAPSCTPSALKQMGDLVAKEQGKLLVQTHIAENVNEVSLVKDLFPDSASYAAVYDDAGLLGKGTILAHAVHLSEEEKKLIAARGAGIAHCPASNSALGSGFCGVRSLVDFGIKVGLGTDVSGGYSVCILDAVRQAYLASRTVAYMVDQGKGGEEALSKDVGVVEGLYLATKGGARVLGLEKRIGGFEIGMSWDVQEIELTRVDGDSKTELGGKAKDTGVDIFGWESWEDKVAKWVWNGGERNVKGVWVGGRKVWQRD